jgi:tetratricopeptide (TPR) repeat protein
MNYFSKFSLVAMLALGGLASPDVVLAQAGACGEEREIDQGLLDEATWKRMNEAFEMVGEEQYDDAMERLVYLRNRAKDDYLKAVVAQGIAQVHWAQGNYDEALDEFELAVELNALPNQTHYSLMYQIAQLYYSNERYDEALDRLELWFCKVPVADHQASAYVLQASIYAQKEDWAQVISSINKALAMAEKPEENWYQLKLAAHYELEQFNEAVETLEIMVTLWPNKKNYWSQLSNTYYKLENDQKALSTIALAYRKGLLDKEQDLVYLSNLYSLQDVPFKSAAVMQEGLESGVIPAEERYWTATGDNWYAAEEYENALVAYEKAGQISDVGKIDLRRAYILIDQERWNEATVALRAALDKGGVSDRQTGEAYLMLGMSEFNQENYDAATAAWAQAARYKETRGQSQQWMTLMQEERSRKAGP